MKSKARTKKGWTGREDKMESEIINRRERSEGYNESGNRKELKAKKEK